MSEISTYISSAPSVPRKPGAIGKPQPGRRVAILPADGGEEPLPAGAEGLIAVDRSDPGLMLGYWQRPDEEAAVLRGQWFIGGDLGVMDADGYVTHTGRNNDIMKALGYRVSPLEVEAVLAQHASVAEVACAEIQVRADVSVIGAFIVPHGERQPSAPEICRVRGGAARRLQMPARDPLRRLRCRARRTAKSSAASWRVFVQIGPRANNPVSRNPRGAQSLAGNG